jgi:hypothetical protein
MGMVRRNVSIVSRLARITRVSFAFLVVMVGLIVVPAAVQASVDGGCTATGTASRSGSVDLGKVAAWHVTAADVLTGVAYAPSPQKEAHLKVVIFGVGLPLLDRVGNDKVGSAGPYRIADYDRYTRVLAVAGTSTSCNGYILIVVDDVSPLTTWAGVIGVIAFLLGLVGLLAGLTQVPSGNARLVGIVVGVVGGFGLGLVLQEMAILDPASAFGLLIPAAGGVLGIILPGLLHSRRAASP